MVNVQRFVWETKRSVIFVHVRFKNALNRIVISGQDFFYSVISHRQLLCIVYSLSTSFQSP